MRIKKKLALTLCTTMVMGISMPVMAADPTVTAPIYSFETLNVVVPTTYEVAFNPEGLTVKTGSTTTSKAQILSRNYGMINKGNKDQVFTVALKIEDQNNNKISFVNSDQEVTDAEDGEYKIHLTAIPADSTEVKVGATPATATKDTTAADLDNVAMTGLDAAAVTLRSGENRIAFKLDKAAYTPKSGSEVTLGSSTSNDVSSNYDLTSLATGGKGITAFTFGGTMNTNTEWNKLTSGIKITAVYSNRVAPSGVTPIENTGAMVEVLPDVTINATTGAISVINVEGSSYQSMIINDGTQDWPMTDNDGTWDWDDAKDYTKIFTPAETWTEFLSGKTVTVKVTLKDGTSITSSAVTLS